MCDRLIDRTDDAGRSAAQYITQRNDFPEQTIERQLAQHDVLAPCRDLLRQQGNNRQTLVEGRVLCADGHFLIGTSVQYCRDLIIDPVFFEQIVIDGKIFGDPLILHILPDQRLIGRQSLTFVEKHDIGKIRPAAHGHKLLPVHRGANAVQVLPVPVEIGKDSRMCARLRGVFAPDGKVEFDVDPADTVPDRHIEIAHGIVVFGRISRRHNDPPLRHTVPAEHFIL